jgi:hypothetical protein
MEVEMHLRIRQLSRIALTVAMVIALFPSSRMEAKVLASRYCSVELPSIHLPAGSAPVTRDIVIDASTCAVTAGPLRLLTGAELAEMEGSRASGVTSEIWQSLAAPISPGGKAGVHAPLAASGTRTAWAKHRARSVICCL